MPASGKSVSGRPEAKVLEHPATPPTGKLLSEVEPESVEWLWPGRLPLGKLAVLDGDPGLGKSVLTLDLAARVSAGLEFPGGGRCGPPGVVLLSAEDGLAETIRPRLDAAGADVERIVALSTVARACIPRSFRSSSGTPRYPSPWIPTPTCYRAWEIRRRTCWTKPCRSALVYPLV